ncbi:MAG: collagen-like protein [Chloroflexi bacterium]|nr:collagen-like protein [Chloroflexota bacterium]
MKGQIVLALLLILIGLLAAACQKQPTTEELKVMIAAEVKAQLDSVKQGPPGERGPAGSTGPQGPRGPSPSADLESKVISLQRKVSSLESSVGGSFFTGSLEKRVSSLESSVSSFGGLENRVRSLERKLTGVSVW